MENFSLQNKTRAKTPRVPFGDIKNFVLGKKYDLSLAFVQPKLAREITRKTKHKNKASNVLAFPLSKNSGEVIICLATARTQAPKYGYDAQTFAARLFIHALLHLKGRRHGDTMDREENQIATRFGLSR